MISVCHKLVRLAYDVWDAEADELELVRSPSFVHAEIANLPLEYRENAKYDRKIRADNGHACLPKVPPKRRPISPIPAHLSKRIEVSCSSWIGERHSNGAADRSSVWLHGLLNKRRQGRPRAHVIHIRGIMDEAHRSGEAEMPRWWLGWLV
jgi:hypothetical protein